MSGTVITLILLICSACSTLSKSVPHVDLYPVHRPLVNLTEVARQTVGRDGPRYPENDFLRHVSACRAPYNNGADDTECARTYTVMTAANAPLMRSLVPLLLESLARVQPSGGPSASKDRGNLSKRAVVIGATPNAVKACEQLGSSYGHTCSADGASGLTDGDHRYPDFKALAFGMAKLRYIVNALTTGSDVLFVDADVVFLRDPFPELLASGADIAVATAPPPCGSPAAAWEGEEEDEEEDEEEAGARAGAGAGAHRRLQRQQRSPQQQGADRQAGARERRRRTAANADQDTAGGEGAEGVRFSTGITFFRSTPGVLRCVYSLLLDMAAVAKRGGAPEEAWEQARFAAFVPRCAAALGLRLLPLPPARFLTTCGAVGGQEVSEIRRKAAMVHASAPPGDWGVKERAPLMRALLGLPEDGDGA